MTNSVNIDLLPHDIHSVTYKTVPSCVSRVCGKLLILIKRIRNRVLARENVWIVMEKSNMHADIFTNEYLELADIVYRKGSVETKLSIINYRQTFCCSFVFAQQ